MASFYEDASLVVIPSGYKTSKIYAEKPTDGSGDLTFTRASDATRVASNGLIEKVRTNLVLQSETFNTTWAPASVSVTPNTTANPLNGALTADTITLTGATTQKFITQTIIYGGSTTTSVYLKAGTHQFVQICLGGDPAPSANFDLVNGTASATNSTASIVSVGGGFFRCSMAATSIIGTDIIILAVDSLAAARFASTASTGTFIAFGAQVETGDIATAYIPTTTAAVSVGPVSNVPRLDYLGSSCPRLLLEPQRTNLATFSEQIDNAAWIKYSGQTITANNAVSPDGNTSADKMSASGGVYINAAFTANTAFAISVFIKKDTATSFRIEYADQSGPFAGGGITYTFSNGAIAITQSANSSVSGEAVSYGNGWIRLILKMTANAATNFNYQQFNFGGGTGWAWGFQMEAGAYATSYIPTLAASVTRVADAASKTGISSLIGQTEGVIFIDFVYTNPDSNGLIPITIGTDSSNNAYLYIDGSNQITFDFVVAGAATGRIQTAGGYAVKGTRYKFAFAYKANDFAGYINGQLIGTDSSGAIAAFSNFYLGYPYAAGYSTPNTVNQALLFPTRLTNAQMQDLTSL